MTRKARLRGLGLISDFTVKTGSYSVNLQQGETRYAGIVAKVLMRQQIQIVISRELFCEDVLIVPW